MKSLNHPLKRIAFIIFLLSTFWLLLLTLLPTPFEIVTIPNWIDSGSSEKPDRNVTRIDTTCATKKSGVANFARDFLIIDAYTASSPYSRLVLHDVTSEKNSETFTILLDEKEDISDEQKSLILSSLSKNKKPCWKELCVEGLDVQALNSIISSCAVIVGQRRSDDSYIIYNVQSNFEKSIPGSLVALIFSIISFFLSVAYDKTFGRVVGWIKMDNK